jgi:hypothetical protein
MFLAIIGVRKCRPPTCKLESDLTMQATSADRKNLVAYCYYQGDGTRVPREPGSGRDVRFIARPPPRSVRAAFPHTAPASGDLPCTRQRLCHASLVLSPVRALLVRTPLGPRPSLHRLRYDRLRSGLPSLFAGFIATMTRSDFSRPCIIGYGSSMPDRRTRERTLNRTPAG